MRRPVLAPFARELTRSSRLSAIRGIVDGVYVASTLKWRGAQFLLPAQSRSGMPDAARATDVARAVDSGLAVLPAASTCLRRSLTLLRELRRLGICASLHLGVRQAAHGIDAHAWVQVADTVVNDDPAVVGTYSELVPQDMRPILHQLT